MKPEEKAREVIDRNLLASGWLIQDKDRINIHAGRGVAIRYFPLKTGHGEADYLLYADGKAIGIVEAKPEGFTLRGVEVQSAKYTQGLPDRLPAHRVPLPFSYESTGTVTQFTNALEPDARSREVFTFHQPETLLAYVGQIDAPSALDGIVAAETKTPWATERQTLRGRLRHLPPLDTLGLWPAQIKAIGNLEQSLAENRPRALIQMATGSGKTFTAITTIYRLIKFGGARRVLFLVDRANIGKQTNSEFQQYVSPYNQLKFPEEFNVQHLRSNTVDPVSRVCISSVQRLYSILKGEPEFDEAAEDKSMFEVSPLQREPLPVVYNPHIPIETFDFIVIDECHRSIYNLWRQVLEYFDAFLIGMTATPSSHTIGFFNRNLVMEYGHDAAVADGVNVGFDLYRIRTKITEAGATLAAQPGFFVPHRERQKRSVRYRELDDDLTYTANQLDADVVAENQIRLVVQTFRDRLFTEIFTDRTEVPKTLIFAKDDSHAEDITRIIREEFGKGNDFCQKITYKTTGKSTDALLAEFRTAYNPRIAVTVDMISTAIDVKPLECIIFMRNVKSAGYFEQMKGRGVRVVDRNTLRTVTPDADAKTHYVIVDAVGVADQDKTDSQPLDRKRSVSFEQILQWVALGNTDPDVISTLAARLARLEQRLTAEHHEEIARLSSDQSLPEMTAALIRSIDPDEQEKYAYEMHNMPPDATLTPGQLTAAQDELIALAVKPFHNADLRNRLIAIKKSLEQVIDEVTPDTLILAGFDGQAKEKAAGLVDSWQRFIVENKGQIEALQILYSRPHRDGLKFYQIKDLAVAIKRPPLNLTPDVLWRAYEIVESAPANTSGGKHLADLVTLVRHAIAPGIEPLRPFADLVEARFKVWLAGQAAQGAVFTEEQRRWLTAIKDHIAASLQIGKDDFDLTPFSQLGGLGKANNVFGGKINELIDELNAELVA